jgi:ankyrin repeat protein
MFRPAQIALIPHPVKTQIFADCRRLGSETGRSLSSARAAFQVGLAYLAGFGVEKDYLQSLDWVTKSVSKGLRIASSFHDLISESFGDHRAENSASRHDRYTHFIRSGFKASTVQYLDVVSGSPPTTYLELKALATDQQFETGLPFYIAHHAVVYGFTHLLHREDGINLQEESSGETALFLACRLGNFQALNNLLSLGADPSIVAFDGCLPIHWLFMFQPECIETAADRLTLGMGVSPQLSASTVHPRYLDPQVPLRLLGTPLAFAVAVASKRAVEVLLQKGADPSIGDPRMKADSRNPIDLAISLHLSDILGLLLEGLEAENRRSLTREWPYLLVECSPTERKLLHGNLSRIALQETIGLVQGEPILGLHGLTITELAESAIRVADLEVASAIIPIETSSKLSRTDRNELMLSCTKSACRGGYEMTTCVDLLEFARSRGARLDCDLDGHWTQRAINIAVEFHQGEILDWFINNGANPNARDPEGRSLLHHMISSGFSSAYPLSRLLKAGANPNLQETTSGNTPLHTAAQEGKLDETATLLEFKADAGIAGESQSMSSALHCAGRSGNPQVVSAIIRYDRRLNLMDAFGRTPLFAAAAGGSAEVVRVLIDAGADCAARDREGISCLHLAAMGQHHQVLELLLGRVGTSDVNSVIPRSGESALHLAIKASKGTNDPSISCCALLLNAGADPNLTNNCGEPAVAVAAQEFSKARNRHRRQLLEMMVKMGADISNCTRTGTSMLHQAVASLDTELVRELIVLGASVNVIDRDGQTPLHKCPFVGPAASTSRPRKSSQSVCELTQSLVDAGADIRSLDNSGFTPLELAVIADNGPMVSTLLDYHKARSGPSQQYNEATGGSSGEQLQTGQAGGSPEHPSDLIEQWASASAVRTKHGKPHTFEHRYEGINILHRQIVKTAWNRAISIQHWASACAFIHKRLHGDTEPLKWPVGLHLFKYALEEDLGPVLAEFMGHYSALCTPDPVLEKVWTVLRTQSLKQSASELRWTIGDRRVHRAMQLVRRNDYTPLLDLPSLTERGYIEAQSERGLIQTLFVNKEESVPNFRVITAFVPYEDQVDREIQEQFNSLLRPMADTYRQQSTGGAATRT